MPRSFKAASSLLVFTLFGVTLLFSGDSVTRPTSVEADGSHYEVWLVDQSNSPGTAFGGTIYVFEGKTLETQSSRTPVPLEVVNLALATSTLCFAETGANPVRPHMIFFNQGGTHAILSFVASGHVVIFDAATRSPVACIRTTVGAGGMRQAHAAVPTADDSHLIVANQNGKLLERIKTNYATNTFALDATLDLVNGLTPNGLARQGAGLRPDNAPICPFVPSNNGPAFISLRGGGMFVVDWSATPMAIVGEYDVSTVPANGCGFAEAQGWVFGSAGGATASNLDQFDVYRFPNTGYAAANPPNTPARELLFSDGSADRDAHGSAVTRNERYVWVADRAGNVAEVFDADGGDRVATVDLISELSGDPTVDLLGSSPDRKFFHASLRGPNPLTGDPHSSTGSTPGLLVMNLDSDGLGMRVWRLVPISNIDAGGVQRADAHGIAIRPTN